jgi:hypothetical protein
VTVEEVVERFSKARPGYVLASYGEVGLPFYRLRLRIAVLEHKELPPIQEFVLRAVAADLIDREEIGRSLGLSESLLNTTLIDLINEDALELGSEVSVGEESLKLTAHGRELLSSSVQVKSTERIVEVDYDGLLRIPVMPLHRYLEPRDLDGLGVREIPPHPIRRPQDSELHAHTREIEQIARQLGGARQQLSDVLAIRKIERASRVFSRAVALVYRPEGTRRSQGQVAFAVGGQLSEPHADAFAKAGLSVKLGIAKRGMEDAKVVAGRILGEEIVAEAQSAPVARDSEVPAPPVSAVETYEHPAILRQALEESQSRLLLISPWLRAGVVDGDFLVLIEQALERGVEFFLGWGMSAKEEGRGDADKEVLRKLTALSKRYRNFHLERLGRTHAKVLICDRRFVVVTSFNWLSFKGDPKRTFRDERGTMVTIESHINQQFDDLSSRFS